MSGKPTGPDTMTALANPGASTRCANCQDRNPVLLVKRPSATSRRPVGASKLGGEVLQQLRDGVELLPHPVIQIP